MVGGRQEGLLGAPHDEEASVQRTWGARPAGRSGRGRWAAQCPEGREKVHRGASRAAARGRKETNREMRWRRRVGERRGLVPPHRPRSGAQSRRGFLGRSAAPYTALAVTSGCLGGLGRSQNRGVASSAFSGLWKGPVEAGGGAGPEGGVCFPLAHRHGRRRLAPGRSAVHPLLTEFVSAQSKASSSTS